MQDHINIPRVLSYDDISLNPLFITKLPHALTGNLKNRTLTYIRMHSTYSRVTTLPL